MQLCGEVPSWTREQGIKILGIFVGHHDFITAFMERKSAVHATLLERIPAVPDVQSAWLLLFHCAQARANFLLRGVQPSLLAPFAPKQDHNLCHCLCEILNFLPEQCEAGARDKASLPLLMEGLRFRSATRMRSAAFWASWADSLSMIWQRHPAVAGELVPEGSGRKCQKTDMASEPLSWRQLMAGKRLPPENQMSYPGSQRSGWQHEAVSRVERSDALLFPQISEQARELVRS